MQYLSWADFHHSIRKITIVAGILLLAWLLVTPAGHRALVQMVDGAKQAAVEVMQAPLYSSDR